MRYEAKAQGFVGVITNKREGDKFSPLYAKNLVKATLMKLRDQH